MYWDKITSLDRESTLAKRKFRQMKRWKEHMKQNEKEGIVVGGTQDRWKPSLVAVRVETPTEEAISSPQDTARHLHLIFAF